MTNVSVNVARAVGPALAGVVIAVAGAGALFGRAHRRPARRRRPARPCTGRAARRPRGRSASGPRCAPGARYARFSAPLRTVIARTALFVLFGSALWALLPVVTVERLGLDASAFGLLMACVGGGAVAGAGGAAAPARGARLQRAHRGREPRPRRACWRALSVVTSPLLAAAILVVAGVAWIAVGDQPADRRAAGRARVGPRAGDRRLAARLPARPRGRRRAVGRWSRTPRCAPRCWSPAVALVATVVLGRVLALPTGEGPAPEPAGNWEDPAGGRRRRRRRRARPRRHRVGRRRGARRGVRGRDEGPLRDPPARRGAALGALRGRRAARALRRDLQLRDLGRAHAPARAHDPGRPAGRGAPVRAHPLLHRPPPRRRGGRRRGA